MIHDPAENQGDRVSGLEQRSRVHFHLCLKGLRNKDLHSNLPPPDSLANNHTHIQKQVAMRTTTLNYHRKIETVIR